MATSEVMDIAMEWFVTMNNSSRAEFYRSEFDAWMLADPRHALAYERAKQQYASLHKAMALPGGMGVVSPEELLREIAAVADRYHRHRQIKQEALRWSMAGLSLVATFAVVVLALHSWSHLQMATWTSYIGVYDTPRLNRLTDGSELYLIGKNSAAGVRMTPTARVVKLDRGEIAVQVKHDDERPFLVEAGSMVVHATGTFFSVRLPDVSNANHAEVRVQDGTVQIDPVGTTSPRTLSPRTRIVGPGQVALVPEGGADVQVQNMDPREINSGFAWRMGRLNLHGTLLEAVVKFNEHNERKLIIDDSSIEDVNVTGNYGFHDLDEFVESLQARGVRYTTDASQGPIHLSGSR